MTQFESSPAEQPHPMADTRPNAPATYEAPRQMQTPPDATIMHLHDALNRQNGQDKLHNLGKALLAQFGGEQADPSDVLKAIRQVYDNNKNKFQPRVRFSTFVKSYPGMVTLCKIKLTQAGYLKPSQSDQLQQPDDNLDKRTARALLRFYRVQKMQSVTKEAVPEKAEAGPDPFEKYNPIFLREFWGKMCTEGNLPLTLENVKNQFIIDRDPVTGGPPTFMDEPIQQGNFKGINYCTYFNLKRFEFYLLAKYGPEIKKHFKDIGAFVFKNVSTTKSLSLHSFGIALDIDPDNNRNGIAYENLNHAKRLPPEFISLFKAQNPGAWGGDWNGAVPHDNHHFVFRANPAMDEPANLSPIEKMYWVTLMESPRALQNRDRARRILVEMSARKSAPKQKNKPNPNRKTPSGRTFERPKNIDTDYRPGKEAPHISDKMLLENKIIDEVYSKRQNEIKTDDLPQIFGTKEFIVANMMIDRDPFTNEPIKFLGKEVVGGFNLLALPFFMMAQQKIIDSGVAFELKEKNAKGYSFRGMIVGGKETSRLSSHAFGFSLDLDPSNNKAHYDGGAKNRGDHPDQVVLAMVNSGLAWAAIRTKTHPEFGDDPMHYQLAVNPFSAEGQAQINSSPIGRRYWNAIKDRIPSTIQSRFENLAKG